MMDKAKLIAELERDEGVKFKPYHDSVLGKLTIGIGRNLDDVGISKDEAYTLLGNDLNNVIRNLDTLPAWQSVKDDPVRSRALVNLAFNMGIKTLSTFKNTLKAIEDKDWPKAAQGIRSSLYAKQVGQRAIRIAAMLETGKEA